MPRTSIAVVSQIVAAAALASLMQAVAAPRVTATRLARNPLITVDSATSLGGLV